MYLSLQRKKPQERKGERENVRGNVGHMDETRSGGGRRMCDQEPCRDGLRKGADFLLPGARREIRKLQCSGSEGVRQEGL